MPARLFARRAFYFSIAALRPASRRLRHPNPTPYSRSLQKSNKKLRRRRFLVVFPYVFFAKSNTDDKLLRPLFSPWRKQFQKAI
jgi:hypothetical protein